MVEIISGEPRVDWPDPNRREKTPFNIIFDTARELKETQQEKYPSLRIVRLRVTYSEWANAMQERRVVIRPSPVDEDLERHLFGVFCGQLRALGAKISPQEEQTAFGFINISPYAGV